MKMAVKGAVLSAVKGTVTGLSVLLCFAGNGVRAEVSVRCEQMSLPTYPYGDPDPVATTKSGLYPYFRYDGQSAVSRPQKWDAVKLSNGRIEVTAIPAIGGKVWGAKDLKTGRDFIYANDAVKFRDIAMRASMWTRRCRSPRIWATGARSIRSRCSRTGRRR